jgi:hypothetical protein
MVFELRFVEGGALIETWGKTDFVADRLGEQKQLLPVYRKEEFWLSAFN